jgi:hypothetical protein
MSDTESFDSVMADMRKVVMDDCYMTRCNMYDDDCYQCQQDILDRMQRAHERELEHVRKAEYARGYHDGQRSMDAEHYAVALRLMHLPLDGGSHENLSKIAYAIYPCATGWTCESSEGLRDRLIDLLGGVHEPDAAMPTYDVLGNERHKAVCELREIQTDAGGFVKALANALGVEWQAPRVAQTIAEVRDRLIHLLGGDEPTLGEVAAELSQASVDAMSRRADQSHESSPMSLENETGITDELRERIAGVCKVSGLSGEKLYAIADRIDEQLKTIRQNDHDEWQLQTDKMRAMLTEQRDEARAKVLKLESENAEWRRGAERDADKLESLTGAYNDAVAERDGLRKKLENVLENARDALNEATGRWAKADEERRELQDRLDAIREAVNAV